MNSPFDQTIALRSQLLKPQTNDIFLFLFNWPLKQQAFSINTFCYFSFQFQFIHGTTSGMQVAYGILILPTRHSMIIFPLA